MDVFVELSQFLGIVLLGCAMVTGGLYWIYGRGFTFRLWVGLIPSIVVVCLASYGLSMMGGVSNLVVTLSALSFGVIGVLINYIIFSRSLVSRLDRIVRELNRTADRLSTSSDQINKATNEVADSTSSQAASIEETSSSLDEIASMTQENGENSAKAKEAMDSADSSFEQAHNRLNELAETMESISEVGTQTSQINKTIDEIAFQINLLSLNASVEAARAGEAGTGFAVVAEEIRNLAQKTTRSAQDIEELLSDNRQRIDKGVELTRETNDSFKHASENVEEVSNHISQITSYTSEQSTGIEQVNSAVGDMNEKIQQNSASTDETAGFAEELDKLAGKVKHNSDILFDIIEDRNSEGYNGREKNKNGH